LGVALRNREEQKMEHNNTEEALLKVEDLARILNCGRTKAWEIVNSHEIRTVRVGRLVRIEPSSLTDYLRKHRR
jgi:excisionase family DNA binding protein